MGAKIEKLIMSFLVVVGMVFLPLTLCNAGSIHKLNDQMYFDENYNYLIWDTGNHIGSAVDLSSAVVIKEDRDRIVIAALSYVVNYRTGSMDPDGTEYFVENKEARTLYAKRKYKNGSSSEWFDLSSSLSRMHWKAYSTIKSRAIDNSYLK
jgi:hypothetical protein